MGWPYLFLEKHMAMKKYHLIFVFLLLIHEGYGEEKYLFVQRILSGTNELPDKEFFSKPCDILGKKTKSNIRIGNSITINLLGYTPQYQLNLLKRILSLSEETGIPIHIHLDGQNWIEARPDLWNWFDKSKAGYNPENKKNVEWNAWNPDSAVKVCWRDWGRQIRILPAINIFSPKVLQAHYEAYDSLIPIIIQWRSQLPKKKKYLFGGIRIGWETGFNYNAFYYKKGNELYDRNPTNTESDPKKRLSNDNLEANNNIQRLGYAAAFYSGIKKQGELDNRDYEQMIYLYLNTLCKYVSKFGISKEELFTHMGGNYAPFEKHLKFWPAINNYSMPGWSFYSLDPATAGTLKKEMEEHKTKNWVAAEWLWPGQTSSEWTENLKKSYSFKCCKLLVIYNWEYMIENDPKAQEGIKEL